jgi:hypothetical protein
MATQYTYNSVGVGRRVRLMKGKMDKIQYNIYIDGVHDSRKDMEQRQIEYSGGTRTTKLLLLLLSL